MFNNRVCYRGSSEMSQIHTHWWHFLTALGYCGFWWCFITKVCSVHHIIIVMFINGVCYRGSSEMSQIHVQWSHFLTAIGYCWFWWCFITKVWSLSYNHCYVHLWSVLLCYGGSSEMCRIWVQWWHFLTVVGYWWFWWSFIRKVWSVDHTIIVIYINGVCYEGTLRGPRGPKNTEYLSLYNRCASRICTLWL